MSGVKRKLNSTTEVEDTAEKQFVAIKKIRLKDSKEGLSMVPFSYFYFTHYTLCLLMSVFSSIHIVMEVVRML